MWDMKLSMMSCYVFTALIFSFSCKKKPEVKKLEVMIPPNAVVFPDSNVDVYMAGYYGDTTDATGNHVRGIAVYWKNNVPVPLTDGQNRARAYKIAVSGSDVYVAGYETINGIKVATYWKNGTAVMLSSGAYDGEATSIVISDNDVYVSGFENSIPRYWKNGIETILSTDPAKETNVAGLYLIGTDVYTFGGEWEPSIGSGVLWKNGTKISVDSTCVYRSATVNGNDVYLTGYRKMPSSSNSLFPAYWQNGTIVPLDTIRGTAMAIAVAGNDVYVAGRRDDEKAKYWKNGILFDLPSATDAIAKSIAIHNNNIYVVGDIHGRGVIWINGNQSEIGRYVVMYDVKVVPK